MNVTSKLFVIFVSSAMVACGGSGGDGGQPNGNVSASNEAAVDAQTADSPSDTQMSSDTASVDITNAVLDKTSGDCSDYVNTLESSVLDIQRDLAFAGDVVISSDSDSCTIVSNNIPNHDFNDASASFANQVATVAQRFTVSKNPQRAASPSPLQQGSHNAVMLNGVPVDILSAGCYDPDNPRADANGNVAVGCTLRSDWLLDPLGGSNRFGTDRHNAHTQPDGSYHYHGNPNALFDDMPGPNGSPVIGFAADGFPIFGSYFYDANSGQVRKAVSGYTLKTGQRPSSNTDPGGNYDGSYVQDWEFTNAGDLDECNGMTVNGQYGYYVTDSYPWIIACYSGTPHPSFEK